MALPLSVYIVYIASILSRYHCIVDSISVGIFFVSARVFLLLSLCGTQIAHDNDVLAHDPIKFIRQFLFLC